MKKKEGQFKRKSYWLHQYTQGGRVLKITMSNSFKYKAFGMWLKYAFVYIDLRYQSSKINLRSKPYCCLSPKITIGCN